MSCSWKDEEVAEWGDIMRRLIRCYEEENIENLIMREKLMG